MANKHAIIEDDATTDFGLAVVPYIEGCFLRIDKQS